MDIPESRVPAVRVRAENNATINAEGKYVLYWMIAARRCRWNFGLERAVEYAAELGKPLVVFEALRAGYKWNSDRIHAFVIQGMANNEKSLTRKRVTYYPYLEQKPGDGDGLLRALSKNACLIVTDDFPCFFLPRMVRAVALRSKILVESVDSNGLFPMRATERVFKRAHDFRRFLQKNLLPHLLDMPLEDPLSSTLRNVRRLKKLDPIDAKILKRWPPAEPQKIAADLSLLKKFKIDHGVAPGVSTGGHVAAAAALKAFMKSKLERYSDRNQPEQDVSSGLSPWLHFGHISAHEVFDRVVRESGWSPADVAAKATGSSTGWWGASADVESFLDELITWREVGYNRCALTDDFDQYESLPEWAQKTLAEHESDKREYLYDDEQFESARTHDKLWNAAQWQLVTTGRMHNYLRMLWGKKILEWTATPRDALRTMIHLNNKYALDGRNPNSYSGIFWILGRYDRAWGPERPVFGKIRFMSSANTARKVKVKNYVQQYSPEGQQTT